MFVILFITAFLKYAFCGESPSPTCQYEILGLDDDITVRSNSDIGDSVYTLNIQEAGSVTTTTEEPTTTTAVVDEIGAKRRRRGEPREYITGEHDIVLHNGSSNFALTFLDSYHEVIVNSCLIAGQTEILEFVINETLDENCDENRLTIGIEPTTPEFNTDNGEDITVHVNSCQPDVTLDVLPVEFNNDADCVSWNCLVEVLNDVKLFWINTGPVIQTSSDDIDFSKTYELLLTCFDSGGPALSSNQIILKVSFNHTILCTTAALTSTTDISRPETDVKGYFETPANVAVVAAVAAVVVGAGVGIGIYLLVSRYCSTKINPVAGKNRTKQDEDETQDKI